MEITFAITLGILVNVVLVTGLQSWLSAKEHAHQLIVLDDLNLAEAIEAFDPFQPFHGYNVEN